MGVSILAEETAELPSANYPENTAFLLPTTDVCSLYVAVYNEPARDLMCDLLMVILTQLILVRGQNEKPTRTLRENVLDNRTPS